MLAVRWLLGVCLLCGWGEAADVSLMQERIASHSELSEVKRDLLRLCPNLMPNDHVALGLLEELFSHDPRPSTDHKCLLRAGFEHVTLRHRGTTFAEHQALPELFFKLAVDKNSESYSSLFDEFPSDVQIVREFVGRIQLRNDIARTIEEDGLATLCVPAKWLYVFPDGPTVEDAEHTPKTTMIVAEKMALVGSRDNVVLWKQMSSDVLRDLFIVMMRHRLYDVKPDNCAFTVDGLLAIVDTKRFENSVARVSLPAHFMSPSARIEWKSLCQDGLPCEWRGYPAGWKG